jgi:hypothetical protein
MLQVGYPLADRQPAMMVTYAVQLGILLCEGWPARVTDHREQQPHWR